MTGPPDYVTQMTDPGAVISWNEYVGEATEGQGVSPNIPQRIETIYDDPEYTNLNKTAYQGGDGQTYYAENFLRPENYVEMGYAAPYTAEEIAQKINPENIRYGYANTPYASLRGASDLSGGEYIINPDTNKFVLDKSGNPIPVPRPDPYAGKFGSSIADIYGPIALAIMAAGTGLGAAGVIGAGAAAGEGAALAGSGEAGLLGASGEVAPLVGSGETGLLAASGEGAVGQALPYTTSFDAANLYGQGLSQAAIEQNLAMTGIDSFLAADAASLASQGLSDAAIAQNLAYGYSPAELAGTGIESLAIPPASPGFGDFLSSFGNLLKTPLGQLGARSGLGLLSSGANTAPKVPGAAAGGSYVPKGMVDYGGILSLLAPKTSTRTSLLG
jgi:hypothetical protein